MPTRYSPDSLGYFVNVTNENEVGHGRKRIVISFAMLVLLDELASSHDAAGRTAARATVTAQGSTIQAKTGGGVGHAGQEWAHQVLRELSLDGTPLHLLPDISNDYAVSFLYCNAAVSKIDVKFNKVDGLIEARIAHGFVRLAERILREAPGERYRSIPAMSEGRRRLIWTSLLEIFLDACTDAQTDTFVAEHRQILVRYVAEATQWRAEARSFASANSQQIYRNKPAAWHAAFASHVKLLVDPTAASVLRAKRDTLLRLVLQDRKTDETRRQELEVRGLLDLSPDLFT